MAETTVKIGAVRSLIETVNHGLRDLQEYSHTPEQWAQTDAATITTIRRKLDQLVIEYKASVDTLLGTLTLTSDEKNSETAI